MDQRVDYADILTRVIHEEGKLQPSFQPRLKIVSVCDQGTGQFLLIAVGWDGRRRVDNILFLKSDQRVARSLVPAAINPSRPITQIGQSLFGFAMIRGGQWFEFGRAFFCGDWFWFSRDPPLPRRLRMGAGFENDH